MTPLLGADAFRSPGAGRRLLGLLRLPAPRRLEAVAAVVLRVRADRRLHGPRAAELRSCGAGGGCGRVGVSWCSLGLVSSGLDQDIQLRVS